MPLQNLMLSHLEFLSLINFEQLDLLVSGASTQILSIGRYLQFEDVILVSLHGLTQREMLTFFHVKRLYPAMVISKCDVLSILAHCNRSDSHLVVTKNRDPFLFASDVPDLEIAVFVTCQDFHLVRVYYCTVDGLVLLKCSGWFFAPEVEYPDHSVFTGCVDQLIMFVESYCGYVALVVALQTSVDMVCSVEIVNFDCIGHPCNQLLLIFGNFDAIGYEVGQLDFLLLIAGASRGVPELDGPVVRTTRQLQ